MLSTCLQNFGTLRSLDSPEFLSIDNLKNVSSFTLKTYIHDKLSLRHGD